jgi:dienelactone hydrolase
VTANNPEPDRLPTLSVWEDGRFGGPKKLLMMATRFPNVPDFTCDSWCYESEVDFIGARSLDGGRLEIRHRVKQQPQMLLVTTFTPEPGAVEIVARAVLDVEKYPSEKLPDNLLTPNLCWQLHRAPGFAGEPEPYPEFVKRCFIFTDRGMTFLDQTTRRKIPVRSLEDRYNNPVWVQMYVGDWQPVPFAGTNAWADYSSDRYTTTLIGTVSRDGKYLAALGSDSAPTMCQAWHDCMHNNPQWSPADSPPAERSWRLKIYAMTNDPQALLDRFAKDFPNAKHHHGLAQPVPRASEAKNFQTSGVKNDLPAFHDALEGRLTFTLSWLSGQFTNFDQWREAARAKVRECLLAAPPPGPFNPVVLGEEERGSYVARKVVLNLTGDSRVLALMTVPKGQGPFPAVLLLHDHGAKFDIGKEKVIQSWDEKPEKLNSAQEWVKKYYGGRFLGDELARRGYVCFATDMLNWSDRGGAGYDGQQALAANLLHLGMSFAGLIAHEDLRAAEFLATRPEVDRQRVAAMGLSVGGYRTWQVAALSEHIVAGVSVCWMATTKGLMVPRNNQTRGQSAYTMIHPGLADFLDFPDVASIACPKPMIFLCGKQDKLFPLPSIEDAYAKMRAVWQSQQAADKLDGRLYDAPHEFNLVMQNDAFAWLDRRFNRNR